MFCLGDDMEKNLQYYAKEILRKNHTRGEWLKINSAVKILYKSASKEEIEMFEDSGAGDTLGMILEYME